MNIREWLNNNPRITTAVTAIVIVLAVIVIVWNRSSQESGPSSGYRVYYSDDDGKTWFADDWQKVPPFDHNGRQAVRAHVFRIGTGEPFVGYLEKFDARAQKILNDFYDDPANRGKFYNERHTLEARNILVKRPGPEHKWVHVEQDREQAYRIKTITGPAGETAEELFPKREY